MDQDLQDLEVLGNRILTGITDEEIDPTLVDRIWDLEPKDLTKSLRAVVIENLRQNRSKFTKKRKEKKDKKKKEYKAIPDSGISLDDLEL